jgi:FMN phosphatase YigB (HAD superfamily)
MNTILFDMGGVLICDTWEAFLLTPHTGLADQLQLDRNTTSRVGHTLWEHYSTRQTREEDYWSDLGKALSINIPLSIVDYLESELLEANPKARESILEAKEAGFRIGIISNNTSFWFSKQVKLANIKDLIDPDLMFLSHNYGVQKKTPNRGLFHIAANIVDSNQTYVVDDNQNNIRIAQGLGFHGIHYDMHDKHRSLEFVVNSLNYGKI